MACGYSLENRFVFSSASIHIPLKSSGTSPNDFNTMRQRTRLRTDVQCAVTAALTLSIMCVGGAVKDGQKRNVMQAGEGTMSLFGLACWRFCVQAERCYLLLYFAGPALQRS